MSKQDDHVKEKNEVRKHLPYWAGEVLKMWDEAEEKKSLKSSSQEARY
jgi:hypothetical protein